MQVDSGFLKIGFRRREFEENGHAHTVLDDMLLASGLIPPVTSCEKWALSGVWLKNENWILEKVEEMLVRGLWYVIWK
jgi:hypothetical protein